MEVQHVITGNIESDIWQQITADLAKPENEFEYQVIIEQDGRRTKLDIDIDLGGGFESGISSTSFIAELSGHTDFRFAIHVDDFIDDIGKFFGLQDVELGYTELDKHLVIKTNDEEKIKALFSSEALRAALEKLDDFDFGIHSHHIADTELTHAFLELNVEDGITDPVILKTLYDAFYSVLEKL